MSNIIYTKAKEAILKGEIDLVNDTIKVVLVDTDLYTSNPTADDALADIPAGARVATSPALSGKSINGGVFVANPATLTAVTGSPAEAIVIYKEGTTTALSPVLLYIDAADYLPITPNGGDIIIDWNGGTGEIFSI